MNKYYGITLFSFTDHYKAVPVIVGVSEGFGYSTPTVLWGGVLVHIPQFPTPQEALDWAADNRKDFGQKLIKGENGTEGRVSVALDSCIMRDVCKSRSALVEDEYVGGFHYQNDRRGLPRSDPRPLPPEVMKHMKEAWDEIEEAIGLSPEDY